MSLKSEFAFLKYCIQRRKDTRFVKNVMSIGDDPSLVNMVAMGDERNQHPLYFVAPDASGSGFFADHNRLLCYLYYADYFGLTPVVEYSQGYCYAEKAAVNGTCNPYEYYFKQPAGIELDELKKSRTVIRSRKENAALAGRLNKTGKGYDFSEEYLNELGRISGKYIRLNDSVGSWMEEQVNSVLGTGKILGVHVRGTDFKRNYKGHPVKVTTQEYLEAAKRMAADKKYDAVFLATDDAQALEVFYAEFGPMLRYYKDVTRSDGDETVMKSYVGRENHRYLLGLEVLRDMYTLAACDGLLAGLSQVSFAARIQKKAEQKEYRDLLILDKGMNAAGEICMNVPAEHDKSKEGIR